MSAPMKQRVERLENELSQAKRRNRWTLACLGVTLAIGVVGGWTEFDDPAEYHLQDVVRARGFVLADGEGDPRAELAVGEGGPMLRLADDRGEVRAGIRLRDEGVGFTLSDRDGTRRTEVSVTQNAANLILYDQSGMRRGRLSVTESGPGLTLYDNVGEPRALLSALEAGGASLDLMDEAGQRRATLGAGATVTEDEGFPESALTLFGSDGEILWTAP